MKLGALHGKCKMAGSSQPVPSPSEGAEASPQIGSGPREIAATPVRETSTRPIGRISSTKSSILRGAPVSLEDEALDRRVDHLGAERLGEAQRLDPVFALAAHLDHRQFALDRAPVKVRSVTEWTGTSRSS